MLFRSDKFKMITAMVMSETLATTAATNATNANTAANLNNAKSKLAQASATKKSLASRVGTGLAKGVAVVSAGLALGKGISMAIDKVTGGNRSERFNEGLKYLAKGEFVNKGRSLEEMGILGAKESIAFKNSRARMDAKTSSTSTNNNYSTRSNNVQIHVDNLDQETIETYIQGGF